MAGPAIDSRVVLHVGCGRKRLADLPKPFRDGRWTETRLDIDPACEPDIIGTITDMAGVADGSVDAVFSSHNIEHVFPHEVRLVLREFLRVLKPSGFAVITCPDLQALGQMLAEGKLTEPLYTSGMGPIAPIDILYGHRASISKGQHHMAHRGGFTAKSLAKDLTQAGFASVGVARRKEGGVNLWALGFKSATPDPTIRAMIEEYGRRH